MTKDENTGPLPLQSLMQPLAELSRRHRPDLSQDDTPVYSMG